MSYVCRFHPKANEEYAEAYAWYEDKVKGLGERFILAVRKKIAAIANHPQTYSSKGHKDFREAVLDDFPYIIVYKIHKNKNEIFVSSVHHAKRHPKRKYRKG